LFHAVESDDTTPDERWWRSSTPLRAQACVPPVDRPPKPLSQQAIWLSPKKQAKTDIHSERWRCHHPDIPEQATAYP
jgi:hypothetical protein